MPPIQKRFPSQKVRREKGHTRTYLILVAMALIALIVGVYVYEFSGSGNGGDFTISFTPSVRFGITIQANQTTTRAITVNATNGFRGLVKLFTFAPQNMTATITPSNVTGAGTATLTMRATYPGNYTVTVTGTSGALSHSVTPRVATPLYATLVTTNGTIKVELYQAQAPKTVNNFVTLAQSGFYDNLVWHRIVKGFVIQTGDPNSKGGLNNSTWGSGHSSEYIPTEIDPSLHNNAGYLGMAYVTDPPGATSQFYINLVDTSSLNGKYAVFGKVIAGMDVVLTIANTPVYSSSQPINLVFLQNVTVSKIPQI